MVSVILKDGVRQDIRPEVFVTTIVLQMYILELKWLDKHRSLSRVHLMPMSIGLLCNFMTVDY